MFMLKQLAPYLAAVLMLVLALPLVGCSQSEVTTSIDAAITAVQVALPILSAAGVPPDVIQTAATWLNGASNALNGVLAELDSQDSAAVQAAKITQLLSAYTSANLPPGTPQIVAQALNAVAAAIAQVLQNFPKAKALPTAGKPYKLSDADRRELSADKEKLAGILQQLQAYQKK